jgi:hypothetical protein
VCGETERLARGVCYPRSVGSEKRPGTQPPSDVSVSLTRGEMTVGARPPGTSKEQHFLREVEQSLGLDTSALSAPLEEIMDELGVIECVAMAEAVWGVELGPRSGTVSQIAELAYEFPTLRALIDAAERAASEVDDR